MGHVKNTNAHRISLPRKGDTPFRIAAGEVVELDGELLDSALETRGVETSSSGDYDTYREEVARDKEATGVLERQAAGESYVDLGTKATIENRALEGSGPVSVADLPDLQSHDGGSSVSNPPINPRTGEEKTPRGIAEAANWAAIEATAKAAGVSVEQLVGVGEVGPETGPLPGEGSVGGINPSAAANAAESTRISGDYKEHTNADLKTELDARGVSADGSTKADLVAALEADDAAKAEGGSE